MASEEGYTMRSDPTKAELLRQQRIRREQKKEMWAMAGRNELRARANEEVS